MGTRFNMDTSLLWTVVFVPGEIPYIVSKFNSLNMDSLMQTTDTCFLPNQQNLIESQHQ